MSCGANATPGGGACHGEGVGWDIGRLWVKCGLQVWPAARRHMRWSGASREKRTSAAEDALFVGAFVARLKPCHESKTKSRTA